MFRAERRQRSIVENSFGQNPLEGFSYYNAKDRMDDVRRLHNVILNASGDPYPWQIDEITWNDLEMDQVFLRINHTNSFIGEQVLYHKLHMLKMGRKSGHRKELEDKLEYLDKNSTFRTDMEMELQNVTKRNSAYYLADFLMNADVWKIGNQFVYHLLQLFLMLFLLLGCLVNHLFFVGLVGIAGVNLVIYLGVKQRYDVYFSSLAEFRNIYDFGRWMIKKDTRKVFVTAQTEADICRLKKMSKMILGMKGRHQMSMMGDAVAIINEYVYGILLIDVSVFNYMMKVIEKNHKEVIDLLLFAGEVDADIAILSYRKSLDHWCKPTFTERGIRYKKVVHPLIDRAVKNDFELMSRAVITGTNASGKSTFMKSVAINAILAQTIHTCLADEAALGAMPIVTCMALRDDILTGESYYFREAKCLKRILEIAQAQESVLIIVDEILKGTNTHERVAASKAILDYLSCTSAITIVATHDRELTQNKVYENYFFNSIIKENDIMFDYQIHKGICESSNAIALLEYLEYPEELIEGAKCYFHENR